MTEMGFVSCKNWLTDRATQQKPGMLNFLKAESNLRWLLGYLSGLNAAADIKKDALGGIDYKIVIDWTDAFCKAHPADNASSAGIALFLKLVK